MTRQELLEQKAALIATIPGKMKANDWHWVQDAASDIREIDAKLEVLIEMEVTLYPLTGAADAGGNITVANMNRRIG